MFQSIDRKKAIKGEEQKTRLDNRVNRYYFLKLLNDTVTHFARIYSKHDNLNGFISF